VGLAFQNRGRTQANTGLVGRQASRFIRRVNTILEEHMRHKHADLIHAWADGAEIEFNNGHGWFNARLEDFDQTKWKFRIKPEPKPDVAKAITVEVTSLDEQGHVQTFQAYKFLRPNLLLTFDGETGKLKTAVVI
jgi:hypothetical protein